MSGFEQTIIVQRSELCRLDLLKLEEILSEIHSLKSSKSGMERIMSEDMVNKFYTILKGVSTEIPQTLKSGHDSHLTSTTQNGYNHESHSNTSTYFIRKWYIHSSQKYKFIILFKLVIL